MGRIWIVLVIGMVMQLVVDMVGFMVFGVNDMQVVGSQNCVMVYLLVCFNLCNLFFCWCFQCSDFCLLVIVQYNIGIMICYVGSDSDCCWIISLCNDVCFVGVEFCVQYVMFDVCFGQFFGDYFRFFDRNCFDQYWLIVCGMFFNIFDNGLDFFCFGYVDQIW